MNFSRIFILMWTLVLAACASHEPKPPKTQESFITLIKRDGTKQFSYALVMDMPDKSKQGGGKRGGGPGGHPDGPPGGGHGRPHGDKKSGDGNDDIDDHFNFMFNEGLNAKLGDTSFCRSGYKELDKKSRPGVIQISGECNDTASDEDKTRFPNPPPKQVKEETIN
jgi:hypothetical protein